MSDSDDDENVAGDRGHAAAAADADLPDALPARKAMPSSRAMLATLRDSPLQHKAWAARQPASQSLHISLMCTDSEDDDDDDNDDGDDGGGYAGDGGYTGLNDDDDDDDGALGNSDGDSDLAGGSMKAGPASLLAFDDDDVLSVDNDSPAKKPARKKPRKGPMDPALKAQKEAERIKLKQTKASEKERLKREKAAAREAAKKEKELCKVREKAERVAERSKLRTRTSVARMEELVMTVTPDIDLLLMIDEDTFQKLCDSRMKIEKLAAPTDGYNAVRWQRKVPRTKFEEIGTHDLVDERFTMVLLDALTFLELLASDELVERVDRIQRTFPADYEVTIVVEGLEKFFRSQATKENKIHRQRVIAAGGGGGGGADKGKATRKRGQLDPKVAALNPMAVEMGLVDLQMESSVRVRLSTGPKETARHVYMYAKAVASAPDKQQYMGFGFCPHSRAPERVDRNGYKGLRRLWLRHLQQFSGISEYKAQAIVDVYPSPQALIKAFREVGKHAIQNVSVRRGEAARKIGPKASELMHKFFTSTDAAVMLE